MHLKKNIKLQYFVMLKLSTNYMLTDLAITSDKSCVAQVEALGIPLLVPL